MTDALIADIVVVAILVISFVITSKAGIIKSIYRLVSIVVAILIVTMLSQPALDFFNTTPMAEKIDNYTYEMVTNAKVEKPDNNNYGGEIGNYATFVTDAVVNVAEQGIARSVSTVLKRIICAAVLFIIVKALLYFVFLFINSAFKLPGLKQVNKLIGGLAGLATGLVIIYIVCGFLALDIDSTSRIRDIIQDTYILKIFYNNNLLFKFFV